MDKPSQSAKENKDAMMSSRKWIKSRLADLWHSTLAVVAFLAFAVLSPLISYLAGVFSDNGPICVTETVDAAKLLECWADTDKGQLLKQRIEMLKGWHSTVKDFGAVFGAALLVPVFFTRKVLGLPEDESIAGHIPRSFYFGWIATLGAFVNYVVYQTSVTCRIGWYLSGESGSTCHVLLSLEFGVMMLFFVVGVVLMGYGALRKLSFSPGQGAGGENE